MPWFKLLYQAFGHTCSSADRGLARVIVKVSVLEVSIERHWQELARGHKYAAFFILSTVYTSRNAQKNGVCVCIDTVAPV